MEVSYILILYEENIVKFIFNKKLNIFFFFYNLVNVSIPIIINAILIYIFAFIYWKEQNEIILKGEEKWIFI